MTTRAASNMIVIATLAIDEAINFKFFFHIVELKSYADLPIHLSFISTYGVNALTRVHS